MACLDGSVKAFQALSGDAIVIQVCPVAAIVPIALQELDVSLTNDDIIRCGVIVQLLMPVLHGAHEHILPVAMHCASVSNLVTRRFIVLGPWYACASLGTSVSRKCGKVHCSGRSNEVIYLHVVTATLCTAHSFTLSDSVQRLQLHDEQSDTLSICHTWAHHCQQSNACTRCHAQLNTGKIVQWPSSKQFVSPPSMCHASPQCGGGA